jgi:hypothetical protein
MIKYEPPFGAVCFFCLWCKVGRVPRKYNEKVSSSFGYFWAIAKVTPAGEALNKFKLRFIKKQHPLS